MFYFIQKCTIIFLIIHNVYFETNCKFYNFAGQVKLQRGTHVTHAGGRPLAHAVHTLTRTRVRFSTS